MTAGSFLLLPSRHRPPVLSGRAYPAPDFGCLRSQPLRALAPWAPRPGPRVTFSSAKN